MVVNENLWQVNKVLVEKKDEDIFSFLIAPTRMNALAKFNKKLLTFGSLNYCSQI